jgi:hypothetical protein
MESSGMYGDVLRHQLPDHGLPVYRMSRKRTHDAAEVLLLLTALQALQRLVRRRRSSSLVAERGALPLIHDSDVNARGSADSAISAVGMALLVG